MTAKKILEDLVRTWLNYQSEHESKDDRFLSYLAVQTLRYFANGRKIIPDVDKNINPCRYCPDYDEDGCPLTDVPHHGDLIERQAVSLSDFEIAMCGGDYKEALKMLLQKVRDTPTIIPANDND
jgi:hypothetical protein